MKIYVPPQHQGQVVEIGYGWHEGCLYRRSWDRSDQAEHWHIADADDASRAAADGWLPWDSPAPGWVDWAPSCAPEDERDVRGGSDCDHPGMRGLRACMICHEPLAA